MDAPHDREKGELTTIYLTGVLSEATDRLASTLGLDLSLGVMLQPGTENYLKRLHPYGWVAVDNGRYSEGGRRLYEEAGGLPAYLEFIERVADQEPEGLLWATAPDTWGDWEHTLAQTLPSLPPLQKVCHPAICVQDGATVETVPWDDVYCVFIGGLNSFRTSPAIFRIAKEAKRRQKWLHFGRVNSLDRLLFAEKIGCDSADGTYLKYVEPVSGLRDIVNWLDTANGPRPWAMDPEGLLDWKVGLYGPDPDCKKYHWFPKLLESLCREEELEMPTIKVPAIKFQEGGHTMFSFVVDAKLLHDFAEVDLLEQDAEGKITGFQRPEIKAHVKEITKFVNREDAMIPNAVVLGFRKTPRFSPVEKGSSVGELSISYREDEKPALIVDGQQRAAAIRDSTKVSFNMAVTAFVAEDEQVLKEHFTRVNLSQPLKKSILHALLPGIEAEINSKLEKDRLPVLLIDHLNRDEDSPFKGRIKTAVCPEGYISEGNMEAMIKESLGNSGCLFNLRGDENLDRMLSVLKNYWAAVAEVWKDAWDMPPTDSRLTHAAGIVGLGHLMDQIGNDTEPEKMTKPAIIKVLRKLKGVCHWTEGSGDWDFAAEGVRPWNGVENTVRGKGLVKGLLNREYRKLLKGNKTEATDAAEA